MWQYCYLLIISLNSDINSMELCFRNHSQNIYGDRPLKPENCNMISKYLVHSAPEMLVAGGINCFWNSCFTARSAEDSAKRKSLTQFLLLLWCNTLNYKLQSPSQENLSETAPLGCSETAPLAEISSKFAACLQSSFIEITLPHGCSHVDILHIFRSPFYKNTFEGLLLTLTLPVLCISESCIEIKT